MKTKFKNYIEIPAYEIKDTHYKDNATVDEAKINIINAKSISEKDIDK